MTFRAVMRALVKVLGPGSYPPESEVVAQREETERVRQQAREKRLQDEEREEREQARRRSEAEQEAEQRKRDERNQALERKRDEHNQAREREREASERPPAAIRALLIRRFDLVQRFLDVATRHVARKDEYGMERWRDLPKLIYVCITRLGETDGFNVSLVVPRSYAKGAITDLTDADGVKLPKHFIDLDPDNKLPLYYHNNSRYIVTGPVLYEMLFSHLEAAFRVHYSSTSVDAPGSETDAMSGADFELRIASMLEKCGCQCETTAASGDQGADLIVHYKGRKIAVQVKRRSDPVSNGAVQEVIAAQKLYRCGEGWVITNSRFTKSAREVATVHDVVLVEGTELSRLQSILDVDRRMENRSLF
jgi:restriction system protein